MEDLGNDAVGKETTRLWRAWRTVHEMVADRVSCAPPTLLNEMRGNSAML